MPTSCCLCRSEASDQSVSWFTLLFGDNLREISCLSRGGVGVLKRFCSSSASLLFLLFRRVILRRFFFFFVVVVLFFASSSSSSHLLLLPRPRVVLRRGALLSSFYWVWKLFGTLAVDHGMALLVRETRHSKDIEITLSFILCVCVYVSVCVCLRVRAPARAREHVCVLVTCVIICLVVCFIVKTLWRICDTRTWTGSPCLKNSC